MRYSISDYMHYIISSRIEKNSSIIDMGGKGKMKLLHTDVINANIREGIDATNLPFENNSFDISVSVATLEHAGNEDKQLQFIDESIRIATKKVLHWIPIHEEVELFLKDLKHNHPCIIPKKKILLYLKEQGFEKIDSITVREHLINLTMIHPKLACNELYKYAQEHKNIDYLILLEKIK